MKFKHSLKRIIGLEQVHVVPLIDIAFLMMIFLILLSPLVSQPRISVKMPKAIISNAISEDSFIITITGEDVLYLNNEIVTIKQLHYKLEKNIKTSGFVLVKADRRASLNRVIDVWDMCRDLGIENINIATNQEN